MRVLQPGTHARVARVLAVWLNAGLRWTLHPTKGLVLAGLCAVAAGVLAWLASPSPIAQLLLGAAAGVAIGFLQRRSMQGASASFQSARTTIEVRKALTATKAGKAAIGLQYAAAAVLVAVSFGHVLAQTDEAPRNPVFGVVAGYLLLMFARDLATLPAVRKLHARPDSGASGTGSTP